MKILKPFPSFRCFQGCLRLAPALGLLSFSPWLAAGPAPVPQAEKTAQVAVALPPAPKAAFADDPASGKDPFFPDSKRPGRVPVQPNTPSPAMQTMGLYNQLVLKGIAHGNGRRLALINNAVLAEGEKAEIKFELQRLTVQCLAIHERSALVLIDGAKETKEIELRKGL